MKKIFIFIMLLIIILLLSGCSSKYINENGKEFNLYYGFAVIDDCYNGDNRASLCYDPTTKACYIIIFEMNRLAMSPYYVLNENGVAEVAIYGKNIK